jgi:PadR family transcriptional regulator AphA
MSLRMALLGLLASAGPGSGYDLAREFSGSLNQVWAAGHSQIYPELTRMAEAGLVDVAPDGPRGRRSYSITDAGREDLRTWLTRTEPSRAVRSETALRAFLLPVLEPEQAADLVRRELEVFHQRAAELAKIVDRGRDGFGYYAAELGLRQAKAISEWAQWAADELKGE